jgi:hypothetical protein
MSSKLDKELGQADGNEEIKDVPRVTVVQRYQKCPKDSSFPQHRSGLVVREMMALSFLDMGLHNQIGLAGDLTGWWD